ncbi:hypothetical protein BN1723_002940, partial [Verticillium longisporum]
IWKAQCQAPRAPRPAGQGAGSPGKDARALQRGLPRRPERAQRPRVDAEESLVSQVQGLTKAHQGVQQGAREVSLARRFLDFSIMARAFTASGQGSWGRLMSNPTAEPHSQQLVSLIFLACYSFFLLPLSNGTCHSRKRAICGPFCRNLEWGRHTCSLVSTTYFDTPRLRPFLYSTPPLTRLE